MASLGRRRASDRERYRERKEEGWCVRNGCPNEAIPGEVFCDYHKELDEERRAKNIAEGKCRCGNPVVEGRSRCQVCLEYHASYSRERYQANKETEKNTSKARYNERKAAGLCVRCGKLAVPGKTQCEYHAEKQAEREAIRRESNASI